MKRSNMMNQRSFWIGLLSSLAIGSSLFAFGCAGDTASPSEEITAPSEESAPSEPSLIREPSIDPIPSPLLHDEVPQLDPIPTPLKLPKADPAPVATPVEKH